MAAGDCADLLFFVYGNGNVFGANVLQCLFDEHFAAFAVHLFYLKRNFAHFFTAGHIFEQYCDMCECIISRTGLMVFLLREKTCSFPCCSMKTKPQCCSLLRLCDTVGCLNPVAVHISVTLISFLRSASIMSRRY